jgi:tRNA nucleotidyltransferase (CCA-adding enzyme)
MSLEDKLSGWIGPSSDTEKDKQDRTERMIREAIDSHEPFNDCSLKVFAKGSYANNTNVRTDSDVDIAVQCTDCQYWPNLEIFH